MKLLCIGDSNTYGYDPRSCYGSGYPEQVLWTGRLDGWEVINCGMNGLKIPTDGKPWLKLIYKNNPDLVAVMLGSNDLLEGCTAQKTAEKMACFVRCILISGKKVLLIAPPPMKTGAWVQDKLQIEESMKLSTAYRDLAEKNGTDFADSGGWKVDLAFDGVHFTEEGHKAFALGLNKHLEKTYHIV